MQGEVEVPRDGAAIYVVTADYFGGDDDHWQFTNEGAFGNANRIFEEAKSNPAIRELWLYRQDGGRSFTLTRIGRRSPESNWEAMADSDATLPDPTDSDDT